VKTDTEIQDRIRALLDEELCARVAKTQERLPVHCRYNYRHSLDTRKNVYGEPNDSYNRITRGDTSAGLPVTQTIGLCLYGSEDPENWPGIICEEPVDALLCPPQAFTSKTTPEVAKSDLEAQIKDLNWLRDNMPGVYTLLWVLGLESEKKQDPEPSEPPKTELVEPEPPKADSPSQEPSERVEPEFSKPKEECSEPENENADEAFRVLESRKLLQAKSNQAVLEEYNSKKTSFPWWRLFFLWLLGFLRRRHLLLPRGH